MRLEPRSEVSLVRFILAPVAAVIASLLLCSGLILWSVASVFEAYWMMLTGSIGSSFALAETLSRATPLIFTGLAAAVAFRARFWNIGAEGQLYAGALMVTFLGTGEINIHEGLLPPILFLGSFVAGSLWLFLPSLIKIRFQVDEVVTTLLLNFVMLLLVSLLLEGPLKDPMGLASGSTGYGICRIAQTRPGTQGPCGFDYRCHPGTLDLAASDTDHPRIRNAGGRAEPECLSICRNAGRQHSADHRIDLRRPRRFGRLQ